VELEPESQHDAAPAPAPTAPAPNLRLNIGGLSKMSQKVTESYFFYSLLQHLNNKNLEGQNASTFK
jgi:hypothetical protein